MSHELRTPLNAILGFGQLMATDPALDDAHREQAAQITRAGHHLLELVNDVLDISRIESGAVGVAIEPVDVDAVIHEVASLIQPVADGADVQVEASASAQDRHVLADRRLLTQVVFNLVGNAVKYNRPGGHVWITQEMPREGWVRVVVRDTGAGIADTERERIFMPFVRLGSSGMHGEGTGLGLAVCRQLAEAMGGVIDFESRAGVGSTFWVEVPAAPTGSRPDANAGGIATIPMVRAGKHTILLIEDNATNVDLITGVCARRPDVVVEVAADGIEGVERALTLAPDLVLLDLHLPDIGGEEVLRRLRAEGSMRDVPVVVVSADADPQLMHRLVAAGATDYLTKPLDVAELLDVIDGVGAPAVSAPSVLHIEDDAANRRLMARVFGQRLPDVALVSAATGAEGITMAGDQPALVLLDAHLTDMSGEDVVDALARDPATRDIPIVMVSGDPAGADPAPAVQAHITKPMDLGELVAVVRRFVPA